ncbi:MAG: hypothetical protein LBU60_02140 [Clostridiales bacterium]|nr:hypothetical protein [Clostridiales bacterium]
MLGSVFKTQGVDEDSIKVHENEIRRDSDGSRVKTTDRELFYWTEI